MLHYSKKAGEMLYLKRRCAVDPIGLFFLLIGMACYLYREEYIHTDFITLSRFGGIVIMIFGAFRILAFWNIEHPEFLCGVIQQFCR
jgi:hypothetical protein